jgi:hypothetical protein
MLFAANQIVCPFVAENNSDSVGTHGAFLNVHRAPNKSSMKKAT